MRLTRGKAAASVLLLLCGVMLIAPLAGCGGGGGSDSGGGDGITITDNGIRLETPVEIPTGHVPNEFRPYVYTVTPDTGDWKAGGFARVTGKNFLLGEAPDAPRGIRIMSFGGYRATNVVYISDTEATCTIPAVPFVGTVPVYVANRYGDNTWSKDAVKAMYTFTGDTSQ